MLSCIIVYSVSANRIYVMFAKRNPNMFVCSLNTLSKSKFDELHGRWIKKPEEALFPVRGSESVVSVYAKDTLIFKHNRLHAVNGMRVFPS